MDTGTRCSIYTYYGCLSITISTLCLRVKHDSEELTSRHFFLCRNRLLLITSWLNNLDFDLKVPGKFHIL